MITDELKKMIETEAMETILSDLGGLDVDTIVESLDNGKIPDEIDAWQPFEYYGASELLDVWSGFVDQFERLITAAFNLSKEISEKENA